MNLRADTDVASCAKTFRARVERELEATASRSHHLRAKATQASQALISFGAGRVWLFGSLAWGEPHATSDVDLLVEGVPESKWQDACRFVERLFEGVHVDLVRAEESAPGLVERVQNEGRRLL